MARCLVYLTFTRLASLQCEVRRVALRDGRGSAFKSPAAIAGDPHHA